MLNRRNLRIKVMQSLFALHQSREANYQLAFDRVRDRFTPDLNSMEVQDRDLLAAQSQRASKALAQAFEDEQRRFDSDDEAVSAAVREALSAYDEQCARDKRSYRVQMVREAERIYHHYIAVLSLAAAMVGVARSDRKVSHTNFLNNAWIRALENSTELQEQTRKLNQGWDGRMQQVKTWFRDIVRVDPEYLANLDRKEVSPADQRKFANYFLRKILLGKNAISDYFGEAVIGWAEDREIVQGMVEKTIKAFDPSKQDQISLHTLSVNWDEDKDFIERLYNEAADLAKPYADLIANNTRNWEVDRLPLTDKIILEMAIAEILNFPNIPVKVSINEYIELAKNYSTPKSRQFVNGILDVIARELNESGAVRKSGRGLIDNK
ncbi:MAG TPA: transcription antitermination factor NusB [Cyclobacteriaceae bacterium]|nr:transcription antitermination factor NusB [Cyclobacteriaceae bacterium]